MISVHANHTTLNNMPLSGAQTDLYLWRKITRRKNGGEQSETATLKRNKEVAAFSRRIKSGYDAGVNRGHSDPPEPTKHREVKSFSPHTEVILMRDTKLALCPGKYL